MHETLCKDVKGYIDNETSGWCFHNGNNIFPLRIKTSEGEILEVDVVERPDVGRVYVVERPDVGKVYALSCAFNSGWRIKTPVNGTLEMQIDNIWTPIYNLKKKDTKKPTICFATMCKNEEHCIRETLESVYKYIDYWVVHDTGSTDKTCEIVKAFFEEKNIPGELFIEEWQGFDVNKTKLFERCYKKTDYILHLDADDLLCGNFSFTSEDTGYLKYLITTKRGGAVYKCSVIFNNSVHWKLLGVAHTLIKNTDNPESLPNTKDLSDRDFYYESRDTGKRSEDPEKYLKDALRLKDQFYRTLLDDEDNLNSRSVFYMAQSYFDQGMYLESAQYYSLYTKLKNTWIEEEFESNLRIITCFIKLKYKIEKIIII
jgi:glycosyltransferase involved in cell wall biosynthesis